METTEIVALVGIGLTLAVAIANLLWTRYTWLKSRSSAGAHKLEEGRRAELQSLRSKLPNLHSSMLEAFLSDESEMALAEPHGSTPRPLEIYAISNAWSTVALLRGVTEYLVQEERAQLGSLLDAVRVAVRAGGTTLKKTGKVGLADFKQASDALTAVDNWALHLLQPSSIDVYLAGKPVVWTGEENGTHGD